jgi:hypothetical protein
LLKVVKGKVFQILLMPMCKHWDQYNTDCVYGFVPILGLLGFLRPENFCILSSYKITMQLVQSSSSFWWDGLWT